MDDVISARHRLPPAVIGCEIGANEVECSGIDERLKRRADGLPARKVTERTAHPVAGLQQQADRLHRDKAARARQGHQFPLFHLIPVGCSPGGPAGYPENAGDFSRIRGKKAACTMPGRKSVVLPRKGR